MRDDVQIHQLGLIISGTRVNDTYMGVVDATQISILKIAILKGCV
jgi:hypothetical protein